MDRISDSAPSSVRWIHRGSPTGHSSHAELACEVEQSSVLRDQLEHFCSSALIRNARCRFEQSITRERSQRARCIELTGRDSHLDQREADRGYAFFNVAETREDFTCFLGIGNRFERPAAREEHIGDHRERRRAQGIGRARDVEPDPRLALARIKLAAHEVHLREVTTRRCFEPPIALLLKCHDCVALDIDSLGKTTEQRERTTEIVPRCGGGMRLPEPFGLVSRMAERTLGFEELAELEETITNVSILNARVAKVAGTEERPRRRAASR